VLAVPISRLPPRRGRLSRVWLAVLLFILYFNLLSAGRVAMERGTVPAWAGLWWTHVVVVVVVLSLTQLPGWLARRRNTRQSARAGLSAA
jgi:lipopolysaccharide export system permease protein